MMEKARRRGVTVRSGNCDYERDAGGLWEERSGEQDEEVVGD